MSRGSTPRAAAPSGARRVPVGNVYDKYGTKNPLARRLVGGFRSALRDLVDRAAPESLIDVGCGEGVVTAELADRLGGRRVMGIDLPDPRLKAAWKRNQRPNLEYRTGDACALPVDEAEFDAASAIEVLEHLPDPEAALREMRRVARRLMILSVPREPLWRVANVARGGYLRTLGNTPGHVNHWSKRTIIGLVERHGEIEDVRLPFPWTMLLVRLHH